jgi:hypothetical protein
LYSITSQVLTDIIECGHNSPKPKFTVKSSNKSRQASIVLIQKKSIQ